ncbi:hypothetical protein EV368DRAFT_49641 [Lentinula lateritia]|uniref:Uncharacterized protein n=1 Tax=Lentinula aff. lateritia TaxID=2804960 RepID=A0ACC1TQ92_9AGAR|nr:hypothetical protein F5876DRAFT_49583 [Lentinula aff. lateritia]KAJ3848263.1 hypothetical protein EV368DRAFT_49641 [Lentinula lateritia]
MDAAKISPDLSYLTIYNTTLRPITPNPDDEDAEEQAQILFYTSRERAVSRDRMLRQVGLAKALVNFSGMFDTENGCESVHSQTRRMIMVCPEPDFCIHAGVELAKTLRVPTPKTNSKGKEKGVKSILKGKDKEPSITVYDYSDASVNDQALRDDLMRGYEQFKLTHGSFTTILSTLGQQALELQLERFFTVWAWSWNIEDGLEFGQRLGTPLHPMYRRMLPLLDTLSNDIPDTIIPIVVTSTHAMPSTRFSDAHLPAILCKHLLSLVPSASENLSPLPSTSTTHDATMRPKRPPDSHLHPVDGEEHTSTDDAFRSTFMGMGLPNMDVGKWGWLNFGKNGKKSTKGGQDEAESNPVDNPETAREEIPRSPDGAVDQSALDDAISSKGVMTNDLEVKYVVDKEYFTTAEPDDIKSDIIPNSSAPSDSLLPSLLLPREFMSTIVHLAEDPHSSNTRERKIYYLAKYPLLLVLINLDDDPNSTIPELEPLSKTADDLLEALRTLLDEEPSKSSTETIPSLTKILQPKDRHIFASGRAPFSVQDDSEMSTSNSIHLFNAQALLQGQHDVQEVFSRGQNPQHWHIARSVAQTRDRRGMIGEMYLQIFRKETSLTDVDNVMTSVIRRVEEDVL